MATTDTNVESGNAGTGAATEGSNDAERTAAVGASGAGDGGVPDASGTADPAAGSEGEAAESIAEGDKPEAKKPEAPAFTEEQLKTAAVKYANSTMAAARRAIAKLERNRTSEAAWEAKAKIAEARAAEFEALKTGWAKNPLSVLPTLGDSDIKALLNRIALGEPLNATPKPEDRIAALEKQLADERKEKDTAAKEAGRAQAKKNVQEALSKDDRFDLVVTTARGREETWEAIETYVGIHGDCPDEKIFEIAQAVESALAADLKGSRKYGAASAAKGASTNGTAGSASASSGKTIEGNTGSDLAKRKPLPDDDDAASAQVMRELGYI